jgi:hypothetical protein
VSPSATVYDSPAPAAGDGLGDAPGEGDADGEMIVALPLGDGLGDATTLVAGPVTPPGVGVGVEPPSQPQAARNTVPMTSV